MRDLSPASYTVLGWSVTDVQSTVRALAANGVALLRFGGVDQDDPGIWVAASGDRVAWFKDPDGNTLSVTQHRLAWSGASGGGRDDR